MVSRMSERRDMRPLRADEVNTLQLSTGAPSVLSLRYEKPVSVTAYGTL